MLVGKKIKRFWEAVIDLFFPPACFGCGARLSQIGLCATCSKNLTVFPHLSCPRCFRRLPNFKNICHPEEKFVLASPLSFSQPAIRKTIHVLKYKRAKSACATLEPFIKTYLAASGLADHLRQNRFHVLPIPLHPRRFQERGFNQAELIAENIATLLQLPLEKNNLLRQKNTPSQIGADKTVRLQNVCDCFSLKNPDSLRGERCLIVDDVFTTGATMREAVRILKQAGVKEIIAFTAAKT